MRQRCPLSLLSFKVVLEFLTRTISQEEEIKGIQIGKEELKQSLFAHDMILYLKDPKNSFTKLLYIRNTFSNLQKSIAFLYNEQIRKEYRKTI
jgi:hypothetical protein